MKRKKFDIAGLGRNQKGWLFFEISVLRGSVFVIVFGPRVDLCWLSRGISSSFIVFLKGLVEIFELYVVA